MRKNVLLLFLILLSVVFAGTVRGEFVDAASLMEQADKLNVSSSYLEAKEIYQNIATNYSHTEEALPAQRKLVCISIALDDEQQAEIEFGKLITDFTGYEQLPRQIHQIGFICRVLGKHEKGKYYYNYVIENFLDSSQAIFSQKDLVKTAIETKDYTAEQRALDGLKTKFANHPDLANALYSIADGYIKEGKYDEANEMNKYIIFNFPESDRVQHARRSLIKTALETGDGDIAVVMEQLSADFANEPAKFAEHPNLPKLICNIAEGYREKEKYDKAVGLNVYLVNTFSQDDQALRAQKNLIQCYISTGSIADANAAIEKLSSDFIDHQDYWVAVKRIADVLCDESEFGMALGMYRRLGEKFPCNTNNINWRKGIAIVKVSMADDAEAVSDVEAIIADFNDHPELVRAVFHIGEEYFLTASRIRGQDDNKAKCYFQKAVSVWEKIITELPASTTYTPRSCCVMAAVYSQELHEHQKSIECYRTVVNDWPEYRYADRAHLLMAYCFEKLARSGVIPEVDAATQICQVCEKLLANYPDSQMIIGAYKLLERYEVDK